MSLLSYQDFLFETFGKVKLSTAKENLLRSISNNYLNEDEKVIFNYMITEGFTEDIFSLCESDYSSLNEENILTKFKEKFQKAKEYIKDKGKEGAEKLSDATKKVIEFGGNILKAVQNILSKVSQIIKDWFEKAKAAAKAAVDKSSDKIKEKVKSMMKNGDKKVSLKDETSHVGEMIVAGTKFITTDYVKQLADATKEAAVQDDDTKKESSYMAYLQYSIINEIASDINRGVSMNELLESLNEGGDHQESGGLNIPYVSKLMDKVGHTPPFSYFHDLGTKAEEYANNMLSKASFYINKVANGPSPYKFAAYGALVGVAVGYYTETWAKGAAASFLHFIPGLGILKSIIGGIGMALAIYGMVKVLAGQDEKEEE